jgi:O-antigen ligase
MAIASVAIHGAVLLYASSRTALGMGVITIAVIIFLYNSNQVRALILVGLGLLLITVMLLDPSFGLVLDSDSAGVQYITRGQSSDQLKGVSGRHEMWSKIWNEYKKSVLFGHGYFITSESGAIEVWNMKANHTAHNIYLQILVSTGAIGFVLFLAAISRLVFEFGSLRKFDIQARQVGSMLAFVFVWYLGWSIMCVSFMGPVRSESVFFFTFVGLGLGQLARSAESRCRNGMDRYQRSPLAASKQLRPDGGRSLLGESF